MLAACHKTRRGRSRDFLVRICPCRGACYAQLWVVPATATVN
ncbi:hypothetical protein SXCC_01516 [Gluconacetobacter sp. SXCC-1]|nr:hypothetical protein SXCC_01516 [Gluconacetobacter sp. SXCC-1]